MPQFVPGRIEQPSHLVHNFALHYRVSMWKPGNTFQGGSSISLKFKIIYLRCIQLTFSFLSFYASCLPLHSLPQPSIKVCLALQIAKRSSLWFHIMSRTLSHRHYGLPYSTSIWSSCRAPTTDWNGNKHASSHEDISTYDPGVMRHPLSFLQGALQQIHDAGCIGHRLLPIQNCSVDRRFHPIGSD